MWKAEFIEILSVLNFWHYTHHFLLLLHIHQISWSYWHLPRNVGKHSLSKQITCVIISEFLLALHFCPNELLLKRGFGVFTGCICLILSCPTLTSRERVCLSAEWLEHGSECSYQQEYLGSVFQWNQKSKDPNHTAISKGIAEFIQKKKNVSMISASLHQFSLCCFHTSSVTLIILFGFFLYKWYAYLIVWEGFIMPHSVL